MGADPSLAAKSLKQRRRDGQRVRKIDASGYETIYLGAYIYNEDDDSEELHLSFNGQSVFLLERASDATETVQYLHTDHLGSVAVMTDEGGQFCGGHSMKKENALKTAAGFSKFWDGATLTKSRASAEPVQLTGKRVSLHLMIQPGVAQSVVGDPIMKDQGLLSRVLIAWISIRPRPG